MCSRKKQCVQSCRCNRCVTLSLGFAKDTALLKRG